MRAETPAKGAHATDVAPTPLALSLSLFPLAACPSIHLPPPSPPSGQENEFFPQAGSSREFAKAPWYTICSMAEVNKLNVPFQHSGIKTSAESTAVRLLTHKDGIAFQSKRLLALSDDIMPSTGTTYVYEF